MSNKRRWINTSGGPHVLLAQELVPHWRGIDGWFDHRDPTDLSDYARACRVQCWMSSIACHTGSAFVMSGEAGPIAWLPSKTSSAARIQSGMFIQWIGIENELEIDIVLQSPRLEDLLASSESERAEFMTGPTGRMLLFDAADPGSGPGEYAFVDLLPGSYTARATYLETQTVMMVVREVRRSSC